MLNLPEFISTFNGINFKKNLHIAMVITRTTNTHFFAHRGFILKNNDKKVRNMIEWRIYGGPSNLNPHN